MLCLFILDGDNYIARPLSLLPLVSCEAHRALLRVWKYDTQILLLLLFTKRKIDWHLAGCSFAEGIAIKTQTVGEGLVCHFCI